MRGAPCPGQAQQGGPAVLGVRRAARMATGLEPLDVARDRGGRRRHPARELGGGDGVAGGEHRVERELVAGQAHGGERLVQQRLGGACREPDQEQRVDPLRANF